ncbi:hypothetical protein ACFPVY_13305 [Flavobacterium qiangtangense]|uniref:GLPGLI family protein n=1 Tax=Flavobacterium qiangtangense TaxID=1442595 RepID=A0ABW1PPW6_9FLAO
MRNTLLYFVLFFIISCQNKKGDIIEIYLTNHRIESYEGVPLRVAIKDSVILRQVLESWGEEIRIDTVNDKPIFMGHFQAEEKDLQKKPFIEDSEIIGLDFKNSRIHFKKSVTEKIYDSLPKWNKRKEFGKQFVLCHNGKIVIKGYLINSYSSKWSSTYLISYHALPDKNDVIKQVSFPINYGLNFEENKLKKHENLYGAFKNREILENKN